MFVLIFLQTTTGALYTNIAMLDMQEGTNPLTGTHIQKIKLGVETLSKFLNDESDKSSKASSRQITLFYLGIAAFLAWHVYEMYLRAAN